MSIETGQVIITCDRCVARLVHDPSLLPVSSKIPAWTSQDAMLFASSAGWSFDYEDGIMWVICPSCASKQSAVLFNREQQSSPVVAKTDEFYPEEFEKIVDFICNHPVDSLTAIEYVREYEEWVSGERSDE